MIKMIKWYFVIFFIVFLFLHTAVYAAGVPLIFSYQGRLTSSSGNLLTGTYYFKFSIWDDPISNPSTGNQLWPICSGCPHSVSKTVASGVFNVDIGDTGMDSLNYDFNTNKNIYLQVEVSSNNSDFETLSPRQRISSAVFAQVSGAVSGTGPSSFGTTSPFGTSVVSIAATSTQSTPLSIQGILNQVANLFQVQNYLGANLFVVNNSGNVGVGTSTPARKLEVANTSSAAQLRLGLTGYPFGEFFADPTGDIQISSNNGNGGNIRGNNENLWVCENGSCDVTDPSTKGNIILKNSLIFDNNFKFGQTETSATTTIYDSNNNPILEFDEGGEGE